MEVRRDLDEIWDYIIPAKQKEKALTFQSVLFLVEISGIEPLTS